MAGNSLFFFLIVIFAALPQISNGQIHLDLTTEITKNERRPPTEMEWEMLKLLSSHPQFIYSEFMESSLNASEECKLDSQKVIQDFLLGRQYSKKSKCQIFSFYEVKALQNL